MTSTFKLTKAEFKKIFKRPSIFIMAIILVVSIFVSLAIFDPSTMVNTNVTYDNATTSQQYYTNFFDPLSPSSKAEFDKNFENIDTTIKYYSAINENETTLNTYYINVINIMDKISNEEDLRNAEGYRTDLVKAIEDYLNEYKSLTAFKDFPTLIETTLTPVQYLGVGTLENYYTINSCTEINKFLNKVKDQNNNIDDIKNEYNTNNIKAEFKKLFDNGSNFVYTTLKGLSIKFSSFYSHYADLVTRGWGNQTDIQQTKTNLLNVLKMYEDYLKIVTKTSYPILIINNEDYYTLERTLNEAKTLLSSNATNLAGHEKISDNLASLSIDNILINLTKVDANSRSAKIKQVKINSGLISELKDIQTKTNENKAKIIDKIETLKLDETTSNIAKEITNYKLLEESYSELVTNKILYNITSDTDISIYSKYYGYGFDELNKFETKEDIIETTYYINNNIYSNSFNQNFTYNQNSSKKTNVFDFMYFAMELCTLIIIIFAMMLVCNLFTGETESGTIKLLLVRPFRRSKIITAKLLATIFFVVTFMLFSSLITFAGGYFVYGMTNAPILSIINGSKAVLMSPILLMIINILTLTFDVIFFVLLALMISVLCKNYAGAISCSLVILIVNYALNIIFGGTFWYSLLPGMNLHLFKYFGNAFITSGTNITGMSGLIQSILITGIESSMTLWFSILISSVYSLVFLSISYAVFQRRDF